MDERVLPATGWLSGGLHQPRQPPSNQAAERALLGALLHNNKALDRVSFLKPEHFADPVNARIFEVISKLIESRRVADAVTLRGIFAADSALDDVGGVPYLTELLASMVGIINAGDYGRVVRDAWMRRELINSGTELVNACFGDPEINPAGIALNTVAEIDQIVADHGIAKSITSLDDAIDQAIAGIDAAGKAGGPVGIRTGFQCIDARIGGLEAGLVYVIGGRPGSGKSSLGHQISLTAARAGNPVLSLAHEMTAKQLGYRTLAIASKVPLFVMRRGNLSMHDGERIALARKELRGLPFHIDDTTGQTPRQIAATIRAAKRKHGIKLVMLDHLNLVVPDDGEGRHGPTHNTTMASHAVLRAAKDNDVAFLELVQLNRALENRDDRRPGLADLRQAGAIEEDCFAAAFVYREEMYLMSTPERKTAETEAQYGERFSAWADKRNEVAGRAELVWGKIRDGEPGTDRLRFNGSTTTFFETIE